MRRRVAWDLGDHQHKSCGQGGPADADVDDDDEDDDDDDNDDDDEEEEQMDQRLQTTHFTHNVHRRHI